jgi:hypothetical protein
MLNEPYLSPAAEIKSETTSARAAQLPDRLTSCFGAAFEMGEFMWKRWVADIHLWLSLIVGLQVLAWVVSGLFMSVPPIERVRSEHRMAAPIAADLAAEGDLAPLQDVLTAFGSPVRRISLEHVAGDPVYVVEPQRGRSALFDARSGGRVSPIDEALARRIAEEAIAGDAPALRLTLIEASPPIEYRGDLPVWRVDFGGADNLSVFVTADTGRVAARRSDLWRVYDFLWALHIMDYREREDFNHPLLIAFSAGALVMAIAGVILLFLRLPARLRGR